MKDEDRNCGNCELTQEKNKKIHCLKHGYKFQGKTALKTVCKYHVSKETI